MTSAIAAAAILLLAGCADDSNNSAASSSACTPKFTVSTMEPGVLKIVAPDYPPMFTYDDDQLGGVDGDFYDQFAKDACLTPEVSILPSAGVIEAIKNGQADVAGGGWFPTAERAAVIGQTEPAFDNPAVFVGRNPSPDLAAYTGKTIGTTQGYLWVADLQAWAGDNAKLYESADAVFSDLKNGRIDVALMSVSSASYRLAAEEDTELTYVVVTPDPAIKAFVAPAVTNFPHTLANTGLGDALNQEVTALRANGTLDRIATDNGFTPEFAHPKT
jgi:polar amino acid transport system substrate-binding protein